MRESILMNRPHAIRPTVFEEFFGMGREESASPFLTTNSRHWSINLTLKASITAAFLLVLAFTLSFFSTTASLSNLLLIIVYFLAGIPSLIESIEDLTDFDVNIDVLMTLAAFSSVLIGSSMEGALLLVLFALSGSIEDSVTAKAKSSLNYLNKLSPSKATVITAQGHTLERAIQDINVGTTILIKSGEIVPLDGVIIDGISSVNLVHLTGESLPVTKKVGESVPAGARNLEGSLTITVSHTSSESTLSKIIQLVTQAQEARPRLQKWFDRLSRAYALSIIGLSATFAVTFPFIFSIPFMGMEGSLYRSVAFLIAASPCALILALPIAYLSAISACAKRGILLKGGVVLDALSQCKMIAFDKTGTLTTGQLTVGEIIPIGSPSSHRNNLELLAIASALERNAVHPIATAIINLADQQKASKINIKDFKSIPGYGIQAELESKTTSTPLFFGHPEYIEKLISPTDHEALLRQTERLRKEGHLIAVLLVDKDLYLFSFIDTVRFHMPETIKRLKSIQLWKLIMLTGDHETSAKRIADELGIDEYYANLKPEDKLEHVTELSQEQGLVMVGDGINDAPALARATVGICMGKVGSGMAIDAAEVILLHDNLEKLDWLMLKAKETQSIVRQNLILASAAIVIASLPALAGWVPLWLAVVMHEGGTVLVGLNALRLLR